MAAGQRDDSCLFMAAFVLSVYVYVYLRIRGPPGAGKKKAINRKEECEEKEEYEAILGAGNEEGLKQKEEYEGKEEYEERRSAGHHCFVLDKQIGHQDTWTGVLPKNVYLERSRLREAAV